MTDWSCSASAKKDNVTANSSTTRTRWHPGRIRSMLDPSRRYSIDDEMAATWTKASPMISDEEDKHITHLLNTLSEEEIQERRQESLKTLEAVTEKILLEVAQEAIDKFNEAKRKKERQAGGLTRSWSDVSEATSHTNLLRRPNSFLRCLSTAGSGRAAAHLTPPWGGTTDRGDHRGRPKHMQERVHATPKRAGDSARRRQEPPKGRRTGRRTGRPPPPTSLSFQRRPARTITPAATRIS